jgi:hypothetical protein
VKRQLLLDLFSGAGGAAMGYHRAGFEVIGVDINPQPSYPFEYYRGDAVLALQVLVERGNFYGDEPAAIHASPPCQHHTTLAKGNNNNQDDHPDLIDPIRELLIATGLPYVIENVVSAPVQNPLLLCGEMFGLDVIRHRLFESNVFLWQPEHKPHRGLVRGYRHGKRYDGPYFPVYGTGGDKGSLAEWQAAMGIDWMPTKPEIAEAIPPAYTEYIGEQLLAHVSSEVA